MKASKPNATAKGKPPTFIDPYVRRWHVEEYQRKMGNWMAIHKVISKLEPELKALDVLGSMLFAEYHRKRGPRMDIVVRLHGRFNALRYELERVELGGTK